MTEHSIRIHRRSLAERCYYAWRDAPASNDLSRQVFFAQCSCNAAGAIEWVFPMGSSPIRVISWTSKEAVARDGAVCPVVAKALADELPAAIDAPRIDDIHIPDQQRLARDYQAELEREPVECAACDNTGYADYAAVPCDVCKGAAYRGMRPV